MVDQVATKEEASDGAHGESTNEKRPHKVRLLGRKYPEEAMPTRKLRVCGFQYYQRWARLVPQGTQETRTVCMHYLQEQV